MRRHCAPCLFTLLLMALGGGGCGRQPTSDPDVPHVLAFVQATLNPETNRVIVEHGLWHVVRCLAEANTGFRLEVFALYDRTTSARVVFTARAQSGTEGQLEADAVRMDFEKRGRILLNDVFAQDASEFQDVLGSAFVIDNYVARHQVRPHIVYVSDMAHNMGVNGLDFTGRMEGPGMERAEATLEPDYGERLAHKPDFKGLQVDVIWLDPERLTQLGAPVVPRLVTTREQLEGFWRERYFVGLLQAQAPVFHTLGAIDCGGIRLGSS